MSKGLRAVLLCLVALTLVASVPAQAASPASGTLSKAKRTLRWSGGPYLAPYPTSDFECLGGATDANCDHFKLKVNMGGGAKIKVSIQGSASGAEALQNAGGQGVAPNDFDLFVYAPNGDQVGQSATPYGHESLTFSLKAKYRNKPYEIRVVPWLVVPGATYKGTISTVKFVK